MTADIKTQTIELFNQILKDDEISKKIEEGIKYDTTENIQMYCMTANKIYSNLKNDYVVENIKNNKWNPSDLAEFSRETMNPDRWQKLQEERLPKGSKEKVKGMYKCKRCKSWYTTLTQQQTRSGDEGMTSYISCTICNFVSKF